MVREGEGEGRRIKLDWTGLELELMGEEGKGGFLFVTKGGGGRSLRSRGSLVSLVFIIIYLHFLTLIQVVISESSFFYFYIYVVSLLMIL